MPRRHVAPPVARPPPPAASPIKDAPSPLRPPFFPLSFSLASTRLSTPSPPPLFPWPHVRAGRPDCRRHAIVPPPSVSSVAPLSSAPFGPCLTSPVPSSSRTRRRPPRPPVLRRRPGTPLCRAMANGVAEVVGFTSCLWSCTTPCHKPLWSTATTSAPSTSQPTPFSISAPSMLRLIVTLFTSALPSGTFVFSTSDDFSVR
jgi:hypothetical protein